MPYKNWQSQTGPHTSSRPQHFTFHFFGENKTFVFDIGGRKINMNLETIPSERFIIFWQIYLLVSLIWEIRYITYFYRVWPCIEGNLNVKPLKLIHVEFSYTFKSKRTLTGKRKYKFFFIKIFLQKVPPKTFLFVQHIFLSIPSISYTVYAWYSEYCICNNWNLSFCSVVKKKPWKIPALMQLNAIQGCLFHPFFFSRIVTLHPDGGHILWRAHRHLFINAYPHALLKPPVDPPTPSFFPSVESRCNLHELRGGDR